MTESKFQPGDFVRHKQSGVGLIKAVDGNPSVVFWANRDSDKGERIPPVFLKSLPSDAPEAVLWSSPDELMERVEVAPLKLVAAALSIGGGSGKVADIRERLAGRIPGLEWDGWWKKTQPQVRKAEEHFGIAKVGRDSVYSLRTSIERVPVADVSKSAKRTATNKKPANKTVWADWFASVDMDEPPPGATGYPAKAASDALAELADGKIGGTLTKLLYWTDESLSNREPEDINRKAALAWRDLLATTTLRWRDYAKQDFKDDLSEQTAHLLSRMADSLGYDKATPDLKNLVSGLLLDVYGTPGLAARRQHNLALLGYLSAEDKNQLITGILEKSGDDSSQHGKEMADLRNAQEAELAHLVNSHESALRERQEKHDAELGKKRAALEREHQEQERLRQQVRDLDAELRAKREESRLEIRKDMLLAIGEVLQVVAHYNGSIDDLAKNVEAGLTLALRAGGAELLDTAPRGKVVAPGVIVRGGDHGDLVLLPAKVKHEAK